jgi:hypothetical protein
MKTFINKNVHHIKILIYEFVGIPGADMLKYGFIK